MDLSEWFTEFESNYVYLNAPHRSSTAEDVFRLTELYILWTLVGFFYSATFFVLLNSSMARVETICGKVIHMYVLHQC